MAKNKLEERIQNRSSRRWKRRARIAAPFAGVPLLFGMLALSVDLIEYQPQEPRPKLNSRPIATRALEARPAKPAARHQATQTAISTSAMMDTHRIDSMQAGELDSKLLDGEMPIPSTSDLRPPTRPYSTRR